MSGSCGSCSIRLDRLTATGMSMPAARHACCCSSAASSTHRLSGWIKPGLLGQRDELARRQEAALRMLPAHQRLDADQRAVAQVQLGLVVQQQLVAVDGVAQLAEQAEPIRSMLVLGRDCRRPPRLRSAWPGTWPRPRSASRVSASWPCSGARAMPMLASTAIGCPSRTNGACSTRTRSSATRAARAASALGSRTANSSPPRRATRSVARTAPCRRCPICCSRMSPTWWPSVSLTSLKRSRSSSSSATGRPSRRSSATACSSRVWSRRRFGKPVSPS